MVKLLKSPMVDTPKRHPPPQCQRDPQEGGEPDPQLAVHVPGRDVLVGAEISVGDQTNSHQTVDDRKPPLCLMANHKLLFMTQFGVVFVSVDLLLLVLKLWFTKS